MQKVSRRNFVIGASAGVLVVGAGVGVPAIVSAQNSQSHQKAQQFASTLATPLTVYVRDASKGEIVLLANNNQVIVHDLDLASRLLNAAQ